MRRILALASAVVVAGLAPAPARAAELARFAVVAGSNEGVPGRAKLWFAEKDADRFAGVLSELGGFPGHRVAVVKGSRVEAFRDALAVTESKVAAARARGERPLLVVYYSGHADLGGLEFAADRLSFDELKALVARSSADAKVVIVDACEAGALTQVRGATVVPAIDFALPTGEVQGTAYVASTALGEAAQESAQLGGSFFTHHLDVAIRGAGDADADGLVTLAEAFRYTAAQTVTATTATARGPQHPTYDFRMAGRGDVVLSDLRRAEAHLRVPPDPGALYHLRGPRAISVEIAGGSAELRLALPAGRYEIERRARNGRARGTVGLARGDDRPLPLLEPTRYEVARSKGGPLPAELFAGMGAQLVSMPEGGIAPAVRVGVRRELGPAGLVVSADYAFKAVTDGDLSYDWWRVGADAALLVPIIGGRRLLEGGVVAGYGWAHQTLEDRRSFTAGDATAGFLLRASIPIGRLRAALDLAGGARTFELNESRTVRPAAMASFVVLYGVRP
jgi:hypothetical protein